MDHPFDKRNVFEHSVNEEAPRAPKRSGDKLVRAVDFVNLERTVKNIGSHGDLVALANAARVLIAHARTAD